MGKSANTFYKIPESIEEDIETLQQQVDKFKKGEITSASFKSFRVPMGIYEQRENNIYMMRIRVAGGIITSFQLKEIADIAREYNLNIHITTRQDIQLHNVNLEDLVPIYKRLYKIGLTCKGGGGNTVRNIIACWGTGFCPYEVFNVLPFALSLTNYMLPFKSSYNLPRKLKIGFSACSFDCAGATIQDLGFIAKVSENKKGFSVYVAGGLGAHSRVAEKIFDFLPAEKFVYVAEATKRVFDKYGNRKNKHKARLRFVIEKFGVKEFKEIFFQALEEVEREKIKLNPYESISIENDGFKQEIDMNSEEFSEWQSLNVFEQKNGKYYVNILLPLGEIECDTLLKFSEFLIDSGINYIKTTQQNMVIPELNETGVKKLYSILTDINFTDTGKRNLNYIIACKGALTCKLGICYSTELAKAISKRLDNDGIYLSKYPDIKVKISGCPNNCGHHITGTIGLAGAVKYINSRPVPYYNIYLGGKVKEGETKLARRFLPVPARYIPSLITEILKPFYEDSEKFKNDFYNYLTSEIENLKTKIEKYSKVKEITKELFYDWGSDKEFSLAGRGAGECGAGVFEFIETTLKQAEEYLEESRFLESVISTARSILIIRGYDPKEDDRAIELFIENFVNPGWVSKRFLALLEDTRRCIKGEAITLDKEAVSQLIKRVESLYNSLDSNLQFQIEKEDEEEGEIKTRAETKVLDLKGVACPINYVKAKLELEKMDTGAILEIILDDGEPIENVPASLKSDGHQILKIEKIDSHYRVVVKKGD